MKIYPKFSHLICLIFRQFVGSVCKSLSFNAKELGSIPVLGNHVILLFLLFWLGRLNGGAAYGLSPAFQSSSQIILVMSRWKITLSLVTQVAWWLVSSVCKQPRFNAKESGSIPVLGFM